jgi:hypothetical protein
MYVSVAVEAILKGIPKNISPDLWYIEHDKSLFPESSIFT